MRLSSALLLAASVSTTQAFTTARPSSAVTSVTSTQLHFGIPGFMTPKEDDEPAEETKNAKKEKEIGLSGVLQLITAGMGAPFLGDYQGVDKETGKFMFSLEANNLVDENGNSKQTQMPYFESGWVDENDEGFKFPWQK